MNDKCFDCGKGGQQITGIFEDHPTTGDQRVNDVAFALFREDQRKTKQRKRHECAGFEVLATVQKVIPGPEILSYGSGEKRYCAQTQERESKPNKRLGFSLAAADVEIPGVWAFSQISLASIRERKSLQWFRCTAV